MSLEYMDSFETQDTSRYAAGSRPAFNNLGRGTGHNGCLGGSGDFNMHVRRAVTSRGTYGQAVAMLNPSSPIGVKQGIMTFVETSGTILHVTIVFNVAGQIEVYRGSGSGTLLATSTSPCRTDGAYTHVEAKATIDDTVGAVQVKVNEVTVINISGVDTRNGGTGVIDQCWIGDDMVLTGSRSSIDFDDWFIWNTLGSVNNTFIGDKRVIYSAANASGTHSDGVASSGTILSCVDEIINNGDTDYISQDSTGLPKSASFGVENAPANVIAILGVQPIAIVRKDDAGTNTGRLLLISGATEADGGADLTVVSTYATQMRIHETDPNTSAAWTVTNFNAIEAGWRRTA